MERPKIAIVIGRNLTNYQACGKPIEPDYPVLPCACCTEGTVFSPEGRQEMASFANAGVRVLGICTACALVLAPAMPAQSKTIYTKAGADQAQRNDGVKRTISAIQERMGTAR